MKKIQPLHTFVILVISALIVGVFGYATEKRLTQTDITPNKNDETTRTESVVSASDEKNETLEKKSCGCCADRIARIKKQIRRARERRLAAQHAETTAISQQRADTQPENQ